jgi:hypothetical protein
MYAALRAIPIPEDVVARSSMQPPCCASTVATGTSLALMIEGVGGLEAHVLSPSTWTCRRRSSGASTTSRAQLAAVIDGMRDRGLIGDDGWLSEQGRAVKQRVESLTDDLAAKPYESLEPASSMS